MSQDHAVAYLLALGFAGMTVYLAAQTLTALREGYFPYTFVTGRLFGDTDRYGSPVLFWMLFVLHLFTTLIFLGGTLLFGWMVLSSLPGARF